MQIAGGENTGTVWTMKNDADKRAPEAGGGVAKTNDSEAETVMGRVHLNGNRTYRNVTLESRNFLEALGV